ncbi:hypothetical protein [Mesobacillus stamsii]|nr:hypothetical protein [Mesobacillus stamsii]MDQ0412358.1 hypothetical protein [Mesobacillus stamsii]
MSLKKRVGDDIDQDKVQKIFTSENQDHTKEYMAFIADTLVKYMELSKEMSPTLIFSLFYYKSRKAKEGGKLYCYPLYAFCLITI